MSIEQKHLGFVETARTRRRLAILSALALVALASACGDDDVTTPVPAPGPKAGTPDATTPKPDAGAPNGDSGPTTDAQPDALTDATADATADAAPDGGDSGTLTFPAPVVVQLAPGRHARLYNVVYTAAGIYAVGHAGDATTPADLATIVVKLLPSGALDTAFGANGVATKNIVVGGAGEIARGIVVQASGKIVVAGVAEHGTAAESTRDITLVRFLANGTVDTTFGTNGVSTMVLGTGETVSQWGLSQYANGDLLVVGGRKNLTAPANPDGGATPAIAEFAVVKVKGDTGAVDTTFGTSGVFNLPFPTSVSPKTATILADGKAVVCGYTNYQGNKPILFKLTRAGTLDATFATNGTFFPETGIPGFGTGGMGEAYAAVLQGDKIVTTGYGKENSAQPANGWLSFRFTANGALDTTYGTGGHVYVPVNAQGSNSRSAVVLADKRIVLVGGGSPPKPADAGTATYSQHAGIMVLGENGAFDPAGPVLFNLGGPESGRASHHFWGIALSPDQKNVAVVGIKGSVTAVPDAGIAGGTDEAAFLHFATGN